MDMEKDESYVNLYQTPDIHTENTHAPEVIGHWHLRNREQLKKRKLEVQKKQMLQWYFEDPKKHKSQRSRKLSQRGKKRQHQTEPKAEETHMAPAQIETQHSGTEALPHLASSPEDVPSEYCFEILQDSFICTEEPARHHDIEVWSDVSKTRQFLTGPDDVYPKLYKETVVLDENFSKIFNDMAEPEVFSIKTLEETMFPETQPCTISEDTTDRHECLASPKSAETEECPINTWQKSLGSDPETAMTEDYLFHLQEIAVSIDDFPQAQEAVEAEHHSHEIYREITAATASNGIRQETPETEEHSLEAYTEIFGAEKYSCEACQEMPHVEDLSTETFQNSDGPNDCLLEQLKKTSECQVQDPSAHQEVQV